jgi:hypothetical protein
MQPPPSTISATAPLTYKESAPCWPSSLSPVASPKGSSWLSSPSAPPDSLSSSCTGTPPCIQVARSQTLPPILLRPPRLSHPLPRLELRQRSLNRSQRMQPLLRWPEGKDLHFLRKPVPAIPGDRGHRGGPEVRGEAEDGGADAGVEEGVERVGGGEAGAGLWEWGHGDRSAFCVRHLREGDLQAAVHVPVPERVHPVDGGLLLLLLPHRGLHPHQRRPHHHRSQTRQRPDPRNVLLRGRAPSPPPRQARPGLLPAHRPRRRCLLQPGHQTPLRRSPPRGGNAHQRVRPHRRVRAGRKEGGVPRAIVGGGQAGRGAGPQQHTIRGDDDRADKRKEEDGGVGGVQGGARGAGVRDAHELHDDKGTAHPESSTRASR